MTKLINFALFQAGWFLAVILQTPWALLWAALFIALHIRFYNQVYRWQPLLIISALGLVIDVVWQWSSLIHFDGPGLYMPYWLMALWLIFPLTLQHSLSWLTGKPLLQAFFGVVGGGGSYWAGTRLGAATTDTLGISLVALLWGLWLPLFYWLLARLQQRSESATPPTRAQAPER